MRIVSSLTAAIMVALIMGACARIPTPGDVVRGPSHHPGPEDVREKAHDEARDRAHAHAEAQAQSHARRAMPDSQMGWNRMMLVHAQTVFAHSYAVGGFWPGLVDYEPGDWTRFRLTTQDGEYVTMERALLKQTADGKKWWRFTWESQGETWIYEALIDPDQQEIRRLRGKHPDGRVKEIPVSEGTGFIHPQKLTEESITGAVVETTQLETKAGSFTAKLARFSGRGGQGTIDWWLSESVPGGVVKYQVSGEAGSSMSGELVEHGTGATSELDSF